MILITSLTLSAHPARNDELFFSLRKNSENPLIDEIHIVTEDDAVGGVVKSINKTVVSKIDRRPMFKDMVDYSNSMSGPVVLANADIVFDNSLVAPPPGIVFCLTRWIPDVSGEGPWSSRPWTETNGMSFDSYIFNPPIQVDSLDFPLGILGCDGKFAYELHQSGLKVVNPSKKIRSFHVHTSRVRSYGYGDEDWVKGSYLRIGITDSFDYNPGHLFVHRTVT